MIKIAHIKSNSHARNPQSMLEVGKKPSRRGLSCDTYEGHDGRHLWTGLVLGME